MHLPSIDSFLNDRPYRQIINAPQFAITSRKMKSFGCHFPPVIIYIHLFIFLRINADNTHTHTYIYIYIYIYIYREGGGKRQTERERETRTTYNHPPLPVDISPPPNVTPETGATASAVSGHFSISSLMIQNEP